MEKNWIVDEIDKIATIGQDGHGVTRLAFSPDDIAAREYVVNLMRENGLTVRIDEIGNVIGRLEGTDPQAAAVVTGSHLDTVPQAGKFDGVVGVIGGIAALRELQSRGPLTHPVEIIVFAGEESSRFGVATIGSRVMAGLNNIHSLRKLKDQNGISLSQLLNDQGFDINNISKAVRSNSDIKAFIELHIEQGAVLDQDSNKIGVVEAVAAPARCKIIVEGTAAHSGTTPMDDRQDALVSAAMIIVAINEIALERSARGIVGTVGAMKVHPGAINVVPGLVEMWVDIRGVDHQSIVECLQEIKDAVSEITERQNTAVSIEMLSSERPVSMDRDIIKLVSDICREKGIRYRRMNSGAGHDAMNIAKITKAGLIFIPCKNGISHNPDEFASAEDIQIGVEVLVETLYQLAK
ncbi:Zn-dependent hydrolase [Dendrosporobacter sp. 1207_IL3150]|uniref:Zn-dependent hydrolase n=1 Tax=Dendrosporobacter sp. 1207_IL3150 TaxID=3084054 RepID=UPI002FD8807A